MFSNSLCFITNKKGTESSKILNLFIHAPLLMGDYIRYYFPGLCGVSETTMWHSLQASATTFPHVPDSRRVMIVLRPSLQLFVFDGHLFCNFILLPPAGLIRFPQEAIISLEAAVGQICFSVLSASCFTHGTKAP